jgi:hypothetical protein
MRLPYRTVSSEYEFYIKSCVSGAEFVRIPEFGEGSLSVEDAFA